MSKLRENGESNWAIGFNFVLNWLKSYLTVLLKNKTCNQFKNQAFFFQIFFYKVLKSILNQGLLMRLAICDLFGKLKDRQIDKKKILNEKLNIQRCVIVADF